MIVDLLDNHQLHVMPLNGNIINGVNSGILVDSNISSWSLTSPCHGCTGRGWVDSAFKGAQRCPVCNGSGQYRTEPQYPTPINPFQPIGPAYPSVPANPFTPQYPFNPWTVISSSGIPMVSGTKGGNMTNIVPDNGIVLNNGIEVK